MALPMISIGTRASSGLRLGKVRHESKFHAKFDQGMYDNIPRIRSGGSEWATEEKTDSSLHRKNEKSRLATGISIF